MKSELRQYLEEELLEAEDGEELSDDDDLLLSGLVDSIGLMRLISFIEETTSLRVPPEDVTIERFRSISSIAAYIEERRKSDG